jgi:hypothetical protein
MLLIGLAASVLALALTILSTLRSKEAALDSYEHDLATQLMESDRGSASLIARAVDLQMSQRLERVTEAVNRDLAEATRKRDRATLEAALRQLMSTNEGRVSARFAETTVTDDKGRLLALVRLQRPKDPARRRPLSLLAVDPATLRSRYAHFSWRDWFSGRGDRYDEADHHHPPIARPHVSDPYASSLDPEGLFVSISAPIRDPAGGDARPAGVLEAAVLVSEMGGWIRQAHLSQGGAALLLDGRRHLLLHTGKPHPPPRLGERPRRLIPPEEDAALFPVPGGTLAHFRDPLDGQEQLAGYARVSDPRVGWVVVVQHDREKVLGPIDGLRGRLGWISWQSFGVMALLVAGLWGWLLWMLRRLERGAG